MFDVRVKPLVTADLGWIYTGGLAVEKTFDFLPRINSVSVICLL